MDVAVSAPGDPNLPYSRAFRNARKRSGLLQREFAERLTERVGRLVGKHAIHRWESGKANVPAFILDAAAGVAEVSLEQLLFEAVGDA